MNINIPKEAEALIQSSGIDAERVCLNALADVIEHAAIEQSREAENVARRTAMESVQAATAALRPAQVEEAAPVEAPTKSR